MTIQWRKYIHQKIRIDYIGAIVYFEKSLKIKIKKIKWILLADKWE